MGTDTAKMSTYATINTFVEAHNLMLYDLSIHFDLLHCTRMQVLLQFLLYRFKQNQDARHLDTAACTARAGAR